MTATGVLIVVAAIVVIATALALAGRWHPDGRPAAEPPANTTSDPVFDVVVRGYRMDQVDAELERLHRLLGDPAPAPEPEVPGGPDRGTIGS